MRSPPGAAASSHSARKSSSSSSSSISASLRSPDMLQGLARGGLARRGSGAVAQALASPSPARPTKQIAGSAAARTTAAAPLARIGMQNDSPLPLFSIGGERKIGNGGNGWTRSPESSCKRKIQKLTVFSLSLSLSLSVCFLFAAAMRYCESDACSRSKEKGRRGRKGREKRKQNAFSASARRGSRMLLRRFAKE